MNVTKPFWRLIDLPGIQALEDYLLMNTVAGIDHSDIFEARCDEVSLKCFRITRRDTYFQMSDTFRKNLEIRVSELLNAGCVQDEIAEEMGKEIMQAYNDHESRFNVSEFSWDEDRTEYLKTLGWDCTDNRGQPLRLTKWFCRQLEAVSKGIAGTMPELEAISAENWGERMAQQARAFKKR